MTGREFRAIDSSKLSDRELLLRHDQMLEYLVARVERLEEGRVWPWRSAANAAIGAIVGAVVALMTARLCI